MTVPEDWKGVAFAEYSELQRKFVSCEACVDKDLLDVDWWCDWTAGNSRVCTNCGATTVPKNDATFVPMSCGGDGGLVGVVSSRPSGSCYMVYNEPELANTEPSVVASAYYNTYRGIVNQDASAKVGGIGLVLIDSDGHCTRSKWSQDHGGADYLVAFLSALNAINDDHPLAKAKLDFYQVHAYYIGGQVQEGYGAVWGGAANSAGTIVTFERFRKHLDWLHGTLASQYPYILSSSTPVWIKETSRQAGDANANSGFMNILCGWLNVYGWDRHVKKVAWFTSFDRDYPNRGYNLFTSGGAALTNLGNNWKNKEGDKMLTLNVPITGNGSRYKDYVWNHGMGAMPAGSLATIGMTGVGGFWGVNTFNPSSTQIRFRVFSADGSNWTATLNLLAVVW